MYELVVIYYGKDKAYSFFYDSISIALIDRDYINENRLADKCYLFGMSKYKIKKALQGEV